MKYGHDFVVEFILTDEASDILRYNNEVYGIFVYENTTMSYDFGIETVPASTACFRGFIRFFKIFDNELILDKIVLKTKDLNSKSINGVKPVSYDEYLKENNPNNLIDAFNYYYKDLEIKQKMIDGVISAGPPFFGPRLKTCEFHFSKGKLIKFVNLRT